VKLQWSKNLGEEFGNEAIFDFISVCCFCLCAEQSSHVSQLRVRVCLELVRSEQLFPLCVLCFIFWQTLQVGNMCKFEYSTVQNT